MFPHGSVSRLLLFLDRKEFTDFVSAVILMSQIRLFYFLARRINSSLQQVYDLESGSIVSYLVQVSLSKPFSVTGFGTQSFPFKLS